jgi:hypothetical protein
MDMMTDLEVAREDVVDLEADPTHHGEDIKGNLQLVMTSVITVGNTAIGQARVLMEIGVTGATVVEGTDIYDETVLDRCLEVAQDQVGQGVEIFAHLVLFLVGDQGQSPYLINDPAPEVDAGPSTAASDLEAEVDIETCHLAEIARTSLEI